MRVGRESGGFGAVGGSFSIGRRRLTWRLLLTESEMLLTGISVSRSVTSNRRRLLPRWIDPLDSNPWSQNGRAWPRNDGLAFWELNSALWDPLTCTPLFDRSLPRNVTLGVITIGMLGMALLLDELHWLELALGAGLPENSPRLAASPWRRGWLPWPVSEKPFWGLWEKTSCYNNRRSLERHVTRAYERKHMGPMPVHSHLHWHCITVIQNLHAKQGY